MQDPIVSSQSEVVFTSDTEEEEDLYLTVSEDEDNSSDPRLELIEKQFNLKMKELVARTSSGQLVPYTIKASLHNTADETSGKIPSIDLGIPSEIFT